MAELAMTPKLLDQISNDEYQEKDKWRIDDIALGPVNELLISGHNLEIPKTFISMHKEDSGKYDNLPEFNQNFDLTQPDEQLVLFLKGSSMIGLKVECALRFFTIKDMRVLESLKWKRSPACVCFYRGKLYAALSSSAILSVSNLDSEEKSDIFLSDMRSDVVCEMVVVKEKIYVCTKVAGRALVFSMTGSKKLEFECAFQSDAKATSICIHEKTELVFVLWNNIQIQLYSQKTSQCLRALDMTEKLHKIRVTTENLLVTLSASKCVVSVYDVGEAIKFGEFQSTILSSVKKKHRKTLMSNDEANLKVDTADFELRPKNWKSALKQSKVENLRDTKELYMKLLEENDNLRRKYDQDVQQLNHDIDRSKKEKDGVTEELEKARSNLSSKEADLSVVQAKLDAARTERDGLRRTNEEKEEKCCSLTKQLEAERKTTEELKHDIDRSKKEKDDVTEELENTRSDLSRREADLLDVQTQLDAGGITKDVFADSIDYMKTGLNGLKVEIKDDTVELTKQKDDVTRELESTKSTLKKKEVYRSRIQDELDAAISKKKELEGTAMKTDKLKQVIQAKEKEIEQLQMQLKIAQTDVENAKTQITILQGRKQELQKSLSREQDKSEKLQRLLSNAYSCSFEYNKNIAQLEDANNRLKIEYDKSEKTQALFSDILENLGRDTLILKTESDTVKEILQTEGKQTHMLVCLQSYFNSRIEILKKDAGTLEYMMGQQNKTIDFEKNTRIPLGAKSLPKVEQMIETGKESVTEMTSFQAGIYSRLEQIHDFKVEKEEIQLSLIESQLQGVQNKMKYETLQYEYFRDMFESMTKMQAALQQSTLLEIVESVVKEISNGTDKLRKLKDNRDKTVEESEVKRDWFELNELQVSLVVSQDGGKLKIPGSDVSLDIPPGALQEECEIQMKIIPLCSDSLSFSSNSSVVVELLPNNLQFQRTVHLRLPHCLHLNDKYNSLKDVEVLISHHEKGDTPKWDVSTDTACTLQKDHCVIPLNKFCWITYRVDDKVVTAKRLKIFTAGRDLELSDRESEVEVGYFPDLPGSGEILRNNPKLSRGQIKPFLFQKNEEESTLLISLQQVIPTEWQNNIELGDQQIISYQSICTGTEMSCPFHLQYKPEGRPSGKVPLCLFHVTQKNKERINITYRPEVKCDED